MTDTMTRWEGFGTKTPTPLLPVSDRETARDAERRAMLSALHDTITRTVPFDKQQEMLQHLPNLATYAAGVIDFNQLLMLIKAHMGEELREEQIETIHTLVVEFALQDHAQEYRMLQEDAAAMARIRERCRDVNPHDMASVFNHYRTYAEELSPDPHVQELWMRRVASTPEGQRQMATWNQLPVPIREATAMRDELQKKQLERMLQETRFDVHLPEGFLLRKIQSQHLMRYPDMRLMIGELDKGMLNVNDDSVWMRLQSAQTRHDLDFKTMLVDVVTAVQQENPSVGAVCSRMSEEHTRALFAQIEADADLSARVHKTIYQLHSKKIAFAQLPDEMKTYITSFELCGATETLVQESLFIDGAQRMLDIALGKSAGLMNETQRADIKATYAKLQDRTLSEAERSTLLIGMATKYDATLKEESKTKMASFQKGSAALLRRMNGEAGRTPDLAVAKEPERSVQEPASLVKPLDKTPLQLTPYSMQIDAVFQLDDIQQCLAGLKGTQFDSKAGSFFGLTGDLKHDVAAVKQALDAHHINLDAYNFDQNSRLEAPEITAAMQAAMDDKLAKVPVKAK